jgi:CheY-like chemotaxis protein
MLQRAFKRECLISPIHIVTDGREGIRYLQGEGEYAQSDKFPFSQLVLLDLNMPNADGF